MVQRMYRNKINWLRTMIQRNPVITSGCIQKAIEDTAVKQEKELRDIKKKIFIYETNGCVAEKLTDTI